MNINKKQYNHLERFDPKRYLGLTPALESPILGSSQRVCLGMHYSLATIFIMVVSVLSMFELHTQNKHGKDMPIKPAHLLP
jgi:cytochrome P450